VGACPRSIIVVAGDVFADALSAASLSDPSDRASQPRLQVDASADPIFIPVGSLDRVDTAHAPILITPSARQGATGLNATARSTAIDFNHGGCATAKQAIIVGGATSVPATVGQELIGLGYDEVFRVGGVDRYDTAAQIAAALGVGSGTSATGCTDPDTSDGSARMGWYGNAVAEFRSSATSCLLLPRAVVLADGGQGADALAAGWWTSFWQVPMLLTAPDGSLPAATRQALSSLKPDALIVLGGTGRIPESSVDQAETLAGGAASGRVAGNDRYATSVAMAQQLGGWWPTGDAADFAGSMVCLASSAGDTGWPDALGAGPWCGAASARPVSTPKRLLPPFDVSTSFEVPVAVNRSHDAVPMLLVPTGSPNSSAAAELVSASFDPDQSWCASDVAGICSFPGFAVAFGGPTGVTGAALQQVSNAVSGGRYGNTAHDTAPVLTNAFETSLDMGAVFGDGSVPGRKVCVPRGGVSKVRWLEADTLNGPRVIADAIGHPPYGLDGDGTPRGISSVPYCWPMPASVPNIELRGIRGVSLSGHRTGALDVLGAPFHLAQSASAGATSSSGMASDLDPSGGDVTRWTFDGPVTGATATSGDQVAALTRLTVTIELKRGVTAEEPDVVSGAFTLTTNQGTVSGSFSGEARLLSGGWRLRGGMTWSGGSWNVSDGSGGFAGDISTASGGTNGDDVLIWNVDGLVR
jgi:hypothetical protein